MNARLRILLFAAAALLLTVSSAIAADCRLFGREESPSNALLFGAEDEVCNTWLGGTLASLACMIAVGAGSYLVRHSDYMSPSTYFTRIKPRHWKLPHEQYLEEQAAKDAEDADCMPAFELEDE